jgi:hypothetical protein
LLKERLELHFLTPIKRNDNRIAENSMLAFEKVLEGIIDRQIVFKKYIIGKAGSYTPSKMPRERSQKRRDIWQTRKRNTTSIRPSMRERKRRSVSSYSNATKTCPERRFTFAMTTDAR